MQMSTVSLGNHVINMDVNWKGFLKPNGNLIKTLGIDEIEVINA